MTNGIVIFLVDIFERTEVFQQAADGLVFAGWGLWMPPQGEISGSVLILVAQFLVLCTTFLGIKDYANLIKRKR